MLIQVDPTFNPRNPGAQSEFYTDWTSPFCAYVGGMGAGKTWVGARKLRDQHVYNGVTAENKRTACKSLIVAQTLQQAQTISVPQLKTALNESGIEWEFIRDQKVYAFHLPQLSIGTRNENDMSLIYVRSAEAAEKIAGFEVGAVWGDEAARWPKGKDAMNDPLSQIVGRLRHPGARVKQINYTYTNEGNATEVYKDFEESPKPGHRFYRGRTLDNVKNVGESYIENMKAKLTPDLADQYLDGKAMNTMGGTMYSSFDYRRNVAVKDEIGLVNRRTLHFAIDFNSTPGMHATVGQWLDDQAQCLGDMHEFWGVRTIPEIVKKFEKWVHETGGWRWPELWVFGDATKATSATRGETTHDVLLQCIQQTGFPFKWKIANSNPLVADRVNATNAAMFSAGGAVRYKVHERCEKLIHDYKVMKWKDGEVDKTDKKISHMSDAASYRIFYLMPIRRGQMQFGSAAVV